MHTKVTWSQLHWNRKYISVIVITLRRTAQTGAITYHHYQRETDITHNGKYSNTNRWQIHKQQTRVSPATIIHVEEAPNHYPTYPPRGQKYPPSIVITENTLLHSMNGSSKQSGSSKLQGASWVKASFISIEMDRKTDYPDGDSVIPVSHSHCAQS